MKSSIFFVIYGTTIFFNGCSQTNAGKQESPKSMAPIGETCKDCKAIFESPIYAITSTVSRRVDSSNTSFDFVYEKDLPMFFIPYHFR